MKDFLCATIAVFGIFGTSEGMTQHKHDTATIPHLKLIAPISMEDSSLSPRSMYDKGSNLILDPSTREYGAWLILKSAQEKCSDALNHFSLTCNIQKIEEYSEIELLQALIEAASRS